jgi:hypothetical protein
VDVLCATMSTPAFFSPTTLGPSFSGQEYIGGGFSFNNPTRELFNEASAMFGDQNELGILLSLGSGRPGLLSLDSPIPRAEALDSLLIRLSWNCEIVAREISVELGETNGYIRFNVDQGMEHIKFNDWRILGPIKAHTKSYLQVDIQNRLLNQLVERLRGQFDRPSQQDAHLQSAALLKTVLSNTGRLETTDKRYENVSLTINYRK